MVRGVLLNQIDCTMLTCSDYTIIRIIPRFLYIPVRGIHLGGIDGCGSSCVPHDGIDGPSRVPHVLHCQRMMVKTICDEIVSKLIWGFTSVTTTKQSKI